MIFVGDVAIANNDTFNFNNLDKVFAEKPVCLNLEGPILEKNKCPPKFGLYNNSNFLNSFQDFNISSVFLANNHIHDIKNGIEFTINELKNDRIQYFGAGINKNEAQSTINVHSSGENYILIGCGWRVIGCLPAKINRAGVNSIDGLSILNYIKLIRKNNILKKVVVVIHGNYEFEKYPQPAHRKLSKELVDAGAYAVIFHHPHIVGPVERYKNRTIAYSIGNWAFSHGKFFDSKLKFPEKSFHQIAVELSSDGDIVHHAKFKPPSCVIYSKSEKISDKDFSLKPEFEGFDELSYEDWFKKNRKKKLFLPIYRNFNNSFSNNIRDFWVIYRQVIINLLVRIGIKSHERK